MRGYTVRIAEISRAHFFLAALRAHKSGSTIPSEARPGGPSKEGVERIVEGHRAPTPTLPLAGPHVSVAVQGVKFYFQQEVPAASRRDRHRQRGLRLEANDSAGVRALF